MVDFFFVIYIGLIKNKNSSQFLKNNPCDIILVS